MYTGNKKSELKIYVSNLFGWRTNRKLIVIESDDWGSVYMSDKRALDDFISLSNKLSDTYQIILIGLTKKQIAQLPKNIIGIERTESIEELAEYYSLAKVFVNPTYQDNFPKLLFYLLDSIFVLIFLHFLQD